jgi:hypothetical protein
MFDQLPTVAVPLVLLLEPTGGGRQEETSGTGKEPEMRLGVQRLAAALQIIPKSSAKNAVEWLGRVFKLSE